MTLLVGPFTQLLTLNHLPTTGHIDDAKLEVLSDIYLLIKEGTIIGMGPKEDFSDGTIEIFEISSPSVCVPGFIDCHTHICWEGSRSHEYTMKLEGRSYQEIAKSGGGILSTVATTKRATLEQLISNMLTRADTLVKNGITTCEVKSGYGLTVEDERKMLQAIIGTNQSHPLTFIPTFLGAHIPPSETSAKEYLEMLVSKLLPYIAKDYGVKRVDIFIEEKAFSIPDARHYLKIAKKMGYHLIIHGDQFSSGGSDLAAELGALSVDHLERISIESARRLKHSGVIPVVLPGASLGLGIPFPPAKMLLDEGLPLAIASDWNPGSAPMGDLLIQCALLGVYQKLSIAEMLAGITVRAAKALSLNDRGILSIGKKADFAVFPTNNYQDIFYYQGSLKPSYVFKEGQPILTPTKAHYAMRA